MPTPIDAALLAPMRARIAGTFDATAEILRDSAGATWGGQATVWVVAASGVPCRAAPSPRLPHEATVAGQEESKQFWHVTLAPSTGPADTTNFNAKDRLRITFANGEILTFEVTAPIPTRSIEVARRAILELVAQ